MKEMQQGHRLSLPRQNGRLHLKKEEDAAAGSGVSTYAPPLSPPPYALNTNHHRSEPSPSTPGPKISPAVLFVIVILAVLFFISGLLHLLVRFLLKTHHHHGSSSSSPSADAAALQRQLQQLFHLHDSGLDQSFIDSLPVFSYKEIAGPSKEPFDCAVCLCEFTVKDQLRLLPTCSHAFHVSCIDTWLLANSTCPLCRGALFSPGFSIQNPVFDYEDEGEWCPNNGENGPRKEAEIGEEKEGFFPVRLGKFLGSNQGDGIGETSGSSNLDERRCYSMGSYRYVVGEAKLRVALRRDNVGEVVDDSGNGSDGKKMSLCNKVDSYSVSKIWLWSKKGKFAGSMEDSPSPRLDLRWMNNRATEGE